MNLELLNPFEQDYPETIECTISELYGQHNVVVLSFNRRGTLLAAGCLEGHVYVWDFDTKGVARTLKGHVSKVTSLSWSRNGRYLLTTGEDFKCIYWDLLHGTISRTIPFATGVCMAQMHPRNNSVFVAALKMEPPVIVDISTEKTQFLEIPTNSEDSGDLNSNKNEKETHSKPNTTLVCRYDIQGKRIFTGTSKGYINIIDAKTAKILHSEKIAANCSIKNILFSRDGKDIVVNSNDRTIRVFNLEQDGILFLRQNFTDVVNKVQWNQCCFNRDGEYVIGGSAHKMGHYIYIWDKNVGNLVKMLEGPKEQLNDLVWHPVRSIIASAAARGSIYIWATNHQENWSAFAPDFKELDENVEYEEREDEFDICESIDSLVKQSEISEDEEIDVTTVEMSKFLQSEPEDEEELFYLPTHPDDDGSIDGEDQKDDSVTTGGKTDKIKSPGKNSIRKPIRATNTRGAGQYRNGSDEIDTKGKKRKYKGY
ncbi:hypothetical protein G9A89_008804 [Geosiphon pyriformis]|nr:hypothetical protein G9A89_008804 [Geosiphon pyriformis]